MHNVKTTDRFRLRKSLRPAVVLGLWATLGVGAAPATASPLLDCLINPYRMVDLASPVPGVIAQLHALAEGAEPEVYEGETVLSLAELAEAVEAGRLVKMADLSSVGALDVVAASRLPEIFARAARVRGRGLQIAAPAVVWSAWVVLAAVL